MNNQDPTAFFRTLMSEWNRGTPPTDGETGDAPATGLKAMVDHALAAANVASRSDVEALGVRITAIEQTLARLEGQLTLPPKKRKKDKKHAG